MGCAISVVDLEPNNVVTTANHPPNCGFGSDSVVEEVGLTCSGGSFGFSCPPDTTLWNGNSAVPGGVVDLECPQGDGGEDLEDLIFFGEPEDFGIQIAPFVNNTFLPIPPLSCSSDAGIVGDPHIKQWDGSWYDWHGECDTVFLHAPDYRDGLGLDIHTRSRIRYWYSYIETAAVRIGSDILEVASWGDFMLNGVSSPELPQIMGGCCSVTHTQVDPNRNLFTIDLGEGSILEVSTHKDIVSIKIAHPNSPVAKKWFGSSSGLMGSFDGGKSLARDGLTVLEDPNDMGQEWQVLDSDPRLFDNMDRAPQFPEKCRLPDQRGAEKERRRKLGMGISREEAAKACAHWEEDVRQNCIYDVMKTNDLDLAAHGGYF